MEEWVAALIAFTIVFLLVLGASVAITIDYIKTMRRYNERLAKIDKMQAKIE